MHNFYMIHLQEVFKNNFDLYFRTLELEVGSVHIAFLDTITDQRLVSKCIVEPLLNAKNLSENIDVIKNDVITMSMVCEVKDEEDAVSKLLHGYVVIAFDFSERAIYCDVKKYAQRAVDIPPTESVLKGPREGFTEDLKTNISLVRKRLMDANLICELTLIGDQSETEVAFVYVQNVAPPALVSYIKKEVGKIQKGFILHGELITEQLSTKRTAFDTICYTEKPDVFCAKISEGKVGIIVQGDPSAITAPCFFIEKFHAPQDYSSVKYIGNFIRIIRWFSFALAMLLPGLYVAVSTYHFSLIPRLIAYRLAITRAGVPFPLFAEYLALALFFQILREAGIRLPQAIGQAMSIVGALILGDAAVEAGLASNITVLVVALCSIATFLSPAISEAIVLWSSVLLLLGALQGLPGFFVGIIILISHLAGLTSCGYPYLYPMGTLRGYKFKDKLLRGDLSEISNNIFQGDPKDE